MNQEPREIPQDSPFLSSKQSEKKSVSQEPHHETSLSSVSPLSTTHEEAFKNRHDSFSENPNDFESHNITGNLLNPSGALSRSLDFGGSQSYLDPNYMTTFFSPMNTTNEEALKSRHGSFLENKNLLNPFGNMLGGSLDSVGSQSYLDSIQMMTNTGFFNKNNGDQSQLNVEGSSNSDGLFAGPMTHNHENQMSVDLRPDTEQQMFNSSISGSGTWFTNSVRNSQHANASGEGYQCNFFLGSGGNIASMSSQRESSQNVMMPISGFVNRSSNNDRNSGQSYNGGGFTTAPEMLLHNPESQMGVSRMQQNLSTESNISIYGCVGMNTKIIDSGTSFTSYTRNSQQAYDNYSEMQTVGEIYDTNNFDVFGHQSNSFLGSGGNNASISSQGDSGQNVMMPIPGGNNTSIHSDQEALTSLIDSFWENPYYHESDNITMNTGNLLMNPSGRMLGGFLDSAGSQIDPDSVQMMPTFGDVKNNNDQSDLGVEGSNDSDGSQVGVGMEQEMGYNYQRSGMLVSGEGYGTNNSDPLRYQSNIPFGSIESMMNAKRGREEIHMIPTPSSANRAQWPIKKILTKTDVDGSRLLLPNKKNFTEQYFQKRLPEVDFRQLVSGTYGISVIVYDNDKHTTHDMCLNILGKNYVLMGAWQQAFVKRRSLREGQEIGLFLDSSDSRLHFSVLNLEIAKVPAKDKKPLVQ